VNEREGEDYAVRRKKIPSNKKNGVAPPSICALHPNPVRKQLPSDK